LFHNPFGFLPTVAVFGFEDLRRRVSVLVPIRGLRESFRGKKKRGEEQAGEADF
tara:strand:- start:1044 stop:1205 length:162 start_codon:yes stop_codon:yes gene_type:complete